jgi:hypothetical protein
MKLFMRGNVEKSLEDFNDGLDKYFATSQRYRSSLRRGTIVLVDDGERMFDFLMFLVKKCGLDVGVVHIAEVSSARKAIEDIGFRRVKAVVIDSDMLGDSLNGDSLPSWLAKECPQVPVWAVNCDEKRRDWIRSQTRAIGVLVKDEPLGHVVNAIGFPDKCQEYVAEFAG